MDEWFWHHVGKRNGNLLIVLKILPEAEYKFRDGSTLAFPMNLFLQA